MDGFQIWPTLHAFLILLIPAFWLIRKLLAPAHWYRAQCMVVLIGLALTLSKPWLPMFQTVEVWSPRTPNEFAGTVTVKVLNQPVAQFETNRPPSQVEVPWAGIWCVLAMGGLLLLLKRYIALLIFLKQCPIVRKFRGVTIVALPSPGNTSPFALRTFTRKIVALPHPEHVTGRQWLLCLAHELQHHRQGDTLAAHALALFKWTLWFNPAVHLLEAWINESQEFLCDHRLIGRQAIITKEYGRCLVTLADHQRVQAFSPVRLAGTTGLWGAGAHSSSHLYRRIETMLVTSTNPEAMTSRWRLIVTISTSVALLALGTVASQGAINDRRISRTQAQDWIEQIAESTDFPVNLNDGVLAYLNHFLGTEAGRRFMRESLQRMPAHSPTIESALEQYRMPEELLAVPLIESGYQNFPQSSNPARGAGIWMFIASTARRFGMRVDGQVDERLHVPTETDAAMRYLGSNFLRFQDWRLALLGYCGGEGKVQQGIDTLGTRDAWKLTEAGYGCGDYLAKLMAVIIIMKHPAALYE